MSNIALFSPNKFACDNKFTKLINLNYYNFRFPEATLHLEGNKLLIEAFKSLRLRDGLRLQSSSQNNGQKKEKKKNSC